MAAPGGLFPRYPMLFLVIMVAFVESLLATLSIVAAGKSRPLMCAGLDFILVTMSMAVVLLAAEGLVTWWALVPYAGSFALGSYVGVKWYSKFENVFK